MPGRYRLSPNPRDQLPEAPEGAHWETAFYDLANDDPEYYHTVVFSGCKFKYKLVKDADSTTQ